MSKKKDAKKYYESTEIELLKYQKNEIICNGPF